MKRTFILTILILVIVLPSRLFIGIYTHDEFGETHFFVKYRPIWKWSFSSPIGMSDMRIEDLPSDKQEEERYFEEFVRKHVSL